MKQVNWPFLPGHMPEIVATEGAYLIDSDGRKILDAAGGAIVANVGYGRSRVADRVREATRSTTYVVPPWLTPSRRALVETLTEHWLPASLAHIHLTSGGSEAVESAVKLALQCHAARGQPDRRVVITRTPSYHGTTLTTASLSGHAARKRGLEAALPVNPSVPAPYPLRAPPGIDPDDLGVWYAQQLDERIRALGSENVAAFLAEPVSGASGGALVPPDDYLPAVRRICNEHGVLLILDEVMTGFGRTGKPFAFEHWQTEPDILVAGKGLAGGYAPLGGVFATRQVGEAIREAGMSVMFHTFAAHPAACAAADEVLTILREENLIDRARLAGGQLKTALEDRLAQHPHVAEIRGLGLLQAVEIVRDRDRLVPYDEADNITSRVVGEALKQGVFFYGGGTGEFRDMVCLGPAFIIDTPEIECMADTLTAAIDAVVG